ncbi:MAG: AbrB/MazE/SpoVT family DNA-binding domain-containing protein [Theionarchaea archaeon]|nr:AbrB/MazE/SpoVT family DNA-binding domain-containing protein [Theionarchaea archaeon]
MTEVSTVNKEGQVTIPREIREKFEIREGSVLGFETREGEIVMRSEKSGKQFVEEWCSIVRTKLKGPMDLKKLKEEFYEQVEEDVLL